MSFDINSISSTAWSLQLLQRHILERYTRLYRALQQPRKKRIHNKDIILIQRFSICLYLFYYLMCLFTFTSILSTPLPMRTTILKPLNFSRSSFVKLIVCHIKAPTASFNTLNKSNQNVINAAFNIFHVF